MLSRFRNSLFKTEFYLHLYAKQNTEGEQYFDKVFLPSGELYFKYLKKKTNSALPLFDLKPGAMFYEEFPLGCIFSKAISNLEDIFFFF